MSAVTISNKDGKVVVESPYHPDFPAKAKNLGGRYSERRWYFDERDETRVRELCRSVYGTDGTSFEGVTVRVTYPGGKEEFGGGVFFAGRSLCHAYGRDSGARLGEGVVILSGGIGSGGSVKNWKTCVKAGTVFEVRDLPENAIPESTESCVVERV